MKAPIDVIPMITLFFRTVRFTALAVLSCAAGLQASVPDWAVPLIAADVSRLGQGYRFVRLADIGLVRYASDQKRRFTTRGAIRVLTESGRSAAACRFTYNADTAKLVSGRAWIVAPDGKTTSNVTLRDFIDMAAKYDGVFWPQERVVHYSAEDNVAVGGCLVWEIETESQVGIYDHTWGFAEEVPTLLNIFDVTPAPGGKVVWHASDARVPAPSAGTNPGGLHWEERDYRPRGGGTKPDGFLRAPRFVSVRLVNANGTSNIATWSDLAKLAAGLIDPRIEADSPELKAKASALAAGRGTRWERIRAVAAFVQREIAYLSVMLDKDTLAGYRPHAAAEILSCRYGDCKDKVTLMSAMLHALGERSYPMLVFSGNPTAVIPEWPAPRFNHMIICLPADDAVPDDWPVILAGPLGKLVLFDPTDPYTPLGVLSQGDQGGHGLVIAQNSTELAPLPVAASHYECTATVQLAANGDLAVKWDETATGNEASSRYAARAAAGREKFGRNVDARFHDALASVEKLRWEDNWAPERAEWHFSAEFGVREYGQRSGELLLFTPQLLAPFERATPWTTRSHGSVWSPPGVHREKARIALPAGCVVDELPERWEKHSAHLDIAIRYEQVGNEVVYEAEFVHKPGFMDRESYETRRTSLVEAEQKWRRPIVLRVPPAASPPVAGKS